MNGFREKTLRPLREQAMTEAHVELRRRAVVQAWIAETILGDVVLGRSGANFVTPPEEAVSQAGRRALKERGVVCYAGAGNYFEADLSSDPPRVIQRRPLAQRLVIVVPGGTA